MGTKLDRLLYAIAPEHTIDAIAARVDEAVNSFTWLDRSRIREPEHVRGAMARLFAHIESHVLYLDPPRRVDPMFDWSRVVTLLERTYGANADHVAVRKALTGLEGGIAGVVRDLANLMIQEYARNRIAACVAEFWNSLSTGDRLDVVREYLLRFGHLLPVDVRENGAARVLGFSPQFLEQHPLLLQKIGRTGRTMPVRDPGR